MGSRLEKNSDLVKKRIAQHTFDNEEGDEYEGSKFGGFPEYFRRKKIKLQNLDSQIRNESGKPQIFRGIVAHVNGYTQPSLNDLHRLVVSHGGGFLQYLDGKTTVTHIIASSLTPKKAIEFRRYRIVKPAWVVESVAAGRVLPWTEYRVLDEGVNQRVLGFNDGKIASQASTQQHGYRDQTDTSWYTDQVKEVATGLDAEDGASFPASQAHVVNGQARFFGDDSTLPQPDVASPMVSRSVPAEDEPTSSDEYDISASLELALNEGAAPTIQRTLVSPEMTPQANRQPALPPEITPTVQRKLDFTDTVPAPQMTTEDASGAETMVNGAVTKEPQSKVLTAEEHNAQLLADPRMWKSSTANPDFIRQYYSESRLHHLSAWKAELKARFQQMASERSSSQKLMHKRKPGSRRYIMHVDFDSFFCAVSLKNAPEFITKPAVVAHGSGTGSEIASCNYPARAFGVRNGMWMKKALELCPNIKVLPYDFPAYEETSSAFYDAILEVGGVVQSVSVDEALIDVTSLVLPASGTDGVGIREGTLWREQEKADAIAKNLRTCILEKTGCTVSVGIGGNILLAKVALRKAKPAGQHQIKPDEVLDFLGDLSVQDLPGVAYSIGGKLEELGIKYVKDVRQMTKARLTMVLGPKTGEKLWDYARGIDRVEVGEQTIRKSVSAEVNWGIRFISQLDAEEFVQNLCIELQRRLVENRVKGHQLTVKIMRKAADAPIDPPKNLGHGKCDTFNKSVVLGVATNDALVIGREAISILRGYGFPPGELRGLGVQMTKLEQMKSQSLPDGSQRRINFASVAPNLRRESTDDIIDEPETPRKPNVKIGARFAGRSASPILHRLTPSTSRVLGAFGTREDIATDDGPDPETPSKNRLPGSRTRRAEADDPLDESSPMKISDAPIHPALIVAKANASDTKAKRLNIQGTQFLAKRTPIASTQFVIPSQIDPEVLNELPVDIRQRLLAQTKARPSSPRKPQQHLINNAPPREASVDADGGRLSRSSSATPDLYTASPGDHRRFGPIPSQLDPGVLEALPQDVRAEVLATYAQQHSSKPGNQTLLPQSPRKVRTITAPAFKKKLMTPPKKRGRGRPTRAETKAKFDKEAANNYTQSSFVAHNRSANNPASGSHVNADADTVAALDDDFLAALPEDIRQEVVAQHRQQVLARKGGLKAPMIRKKRVNPNEAGGNNTRRIILDPARPKPTFTVENLSALPELRDMMSSWVAECASEGPHADDVAALARHLRRVVIEEKDMAKVVSLLKWLGWTIEEETPQGFRPWREALVSLRAGVQEAVSTRGLGAVTW